MTLCEPGEGRFFPRFVFTAYGFLSLAGQLLLLRELSVLFYGNELFIGFSLGAWLVWVGLGSAWGQKLPPDLFPLLFALLGPVIASEVLLIRFAKLCFGFGMLVGPVATMAATLLLLLPIGLLAGAIFSTGTNFSGQRLGLRSAQIYFYECAGAVLYGVLYTAFFAGSVQNYPLAIILNGAAVLVNVPFAKSFKIRSRSFRAFLFIALAAGVLALPFWDAFSHKIQWKSYELLAVRDSRFSNLVVTKTNEMKGVFENGLIGAHFPDSEAHEEIVHLALLGHTNPKEILILGNAATGELSEILKHDPRRVDFAELDSKKIALVEPFLDAKDRSALKDPRVRVHFADGRAFLKKVSGPYDVILLNLPEPSNAQINRFYTQDFFKEAAAHLRPYGILALSIPSSENYLPPEVAFFNRSIFRTLKTVFAHISVIPGQSLLLLAHQNPLELSPSVLSNRYRTRRLQTTAVVPSYFPIKLDRNRIAFFEESLSGGDAPALNRDFAPASYRYYWDVWRLKFRSPAHFSGLLLSAIAAFFALKFFAQKRAGFFKSREGAVIFLLGFSGMVYEILLLFAFQATQGYLYGRIGLLFALFMAGLALGSALGRRKIFRAGSRRTFFLLCSAQALLGLTAGLFLYFLAANVFGAIAPLNSLPYYFFMFLAGGIPGLGFSLLSRSSPAGALYAADLFGGALGAFLTGLFLVPLFGLISLFWIIAAMLLVAGLVLRREAR